MSTRARAARATSISVATKTRKQQQRQEGVDDMAMDVDGEKKSSGHSAAKTKVVSNGRGTTKKMKAATGRKAKEGKKLESVDCICSKGDDGSPMILCSECKIWYHFTCVDITELQAEEINVYICSTCTQTTGRRSAMHWEGDQAVEECSDDDDAIVQRRKAVLKSRPKNQRGDPDKKPRHQDARMVEPIKFEAEESDESDDSEDEYVEENGPKRPLPRVRKLSTTSTSEDSDSGTRRRRVTRVRPHSPSPSPSVPHASKRKAKSASVGKGASPAPPTKRKRSATASEASNAAQDDPVRKYCLSKLEEMFKEVYLRYPYVRLKAEEEHGEDGETNKIIKKEFAEMSEEEKEAVVEDSKRFARELETCVYEIYAEPDKTGNPHAGPKYKDRFRTLQFNLSKPDRVVIHQRITSGNLSAKEISTMSSTDLADEEMKQSIIQAEKESLEHSILQKQIAPRAKITHKGLQDIEDVRGEGNTTQEFDLEKERQQEEEERRERERLARLRTTTVQMSRQRTASVSVPPESPTVPPSSAATSFDGHHQEQWGAPPPVPFHAMVSPADESGHEQRPPLFVNSASEFVAEPELNLGDFINIDEDQDGTHANTTTATTEDGLNDSSTISDQTDMVMSPTEGTFLAQSPMSVTGISPFAQRPDMPMGPSFSLSSLWSEQSSVDPGDMGPTATDADKAKAILTEDKPKNVTPSGEEPRDDSDNMELESVEANDQDFDMFLADEAGSDSTPPVPAAPPSVDSLPQVWVGKITMPLDSGMPQETTLVARQIGGKPLPADSPLWKTLFPSEMLRIEGRVPVDNSVKYLVQMRLNPTKELYGAVFVPAEPQSEDDFNAFNNFLISKSRHGLVFPWGTRPKEYHPGRELYMIPLLQTHPLPEFVELLDDLKLPAIRTRDYLIGVWILNKGKLAPPPGQPLPLAPPVQSQVQSIPALPNNGPLPPVSQIPPLNILAGLPPTSNPSALVAEVASLTPEQIQNILRTLTSPTQAPLPGQIAPLLGHSPPVGQISQPPFSPLSPANQPWGTQVPPSAFPVNFPPPNMPFQHSHSFDHQSPDRRDSSGYDRDYRFGPQRDHDRDYNRGNDRGDRGWRGHGRGRGGRGRGRDDDRDTRPRDSGWPRKSRNEGHEGPSW